MPPYALLRRASLLMESLGTLGRALQARERGRSERLGIPVSHLNALRILSRAGPLTVSGLGERLLLDTSTASRLAKSLLQAGLLRKRRPPSDDRKVILQVTEQGIRLSRRISNELAEEMVEILSAFDPEDQEALPILLGELAERLTVHAPSPALPEDSS